MAKELVCLLIIILLTTGFSGCSGDKEASQKEAKMQQLLSQKTEKNVRIEKWKVVEITKSSAATNVVKIINPDTDKMKTLEVEGHNDLETGMDVIIEIRVKDLSMDKFADTLKHREFVKILYY